MTWVDLVVLAVLALSALLAFTRGLVREVLGLAAWVGADLRRASGRCRACGRSSSSGSALALGRPGRLRAWCSSISLIVLLLIVAAGSARWSAPRPIGGLDRTLGLVFGLARGAALVILAYIIAGMVIPVDRWPEPVLAGTLAAADLSGRRVGSCSSCRRNTGPQRSRAAAGRQATRGGRAAARHPARPGGRQPPIAIRRVLA